MTSGFRRGAALVLTTTLVGLAVYTVWARVGDWRLLELLGIGIVLGLVYALRGSLPSSLVRMSGARITHDDDPRNLSPKVYLPVLIIVILLAALLYWHYAGSGHRR